MKAFCFYQERKWIKIKVTFQAMSKQAEPAVLRQISKHLALLGALEFEPKHMLKMMNHLVDKHRQLGRRATGPALRQIDGSRGVVVDGQSVVLSRRGSIIRRNLRPWSGQQPRKAQRCDLRGRHELDTGMLLDNRKIELVRNPSFDCGKQGLPGQTGQPGNFGRAC